MEGKNTFLTVIFVIIRKKMMALEDPLFIYQKKHSVKFKLLHSSHVKSVFILSSHMYQK